jgi:hypothetical protein
MTKHTLLSNGGPYLYLQRAHGKLGLATLGCPFANMLDEDSGRPNCGSWCPLFRVEDDVVVGTKVRLDCAPAAPPIFIEKEV